MLVDDVGVDGSQRTGRIKAVRLVRLGVDAVICIQVWRISSDKRRHKNNWDDSEETHGGLCVFLMFRDVALVGLF